MTGNDDTRIGITADGLVAVRASDAARHLGVEDPYAAWFVTDAGCALRDAALQIDRVYERFNLLRFRRTTELLRRHAPRFSQVVLLGAGFDCRALWLDELRAPGQHIFEVDQDDKLDQKARVLRDHGVTIPARLHAIPADLRAGDLPARLRAQRYDPGVPSLVLAEGLTFFLPTDTTRALLDPACLGLAAGSRVVFDCWSLERVRTLNHRTRRHMGVDLFQPFPWTVSREALEPGLRELGYHEVRIECLDGPAAPADPGSPADEFAESWLLVEAAV